ncbi:TolB family protein [Angustibacter sp. McL0619]|uniref:TolB family protein n=1 Tax=Angustibacter sp. McL0619 TaxID=3415676 RepID=UPI003CF637A5
MRDGQILYTPFVDAVGDVTLFTVNPDGTHARQAYPYAMECPHWSPDGRQVASCGTPGGDGTTILDIDTGHTRLLPFLAPGLFSPCFVWSPDGSRLACEGATDEGTQNGIYTVRVRDWGDVRKVTSIPGGDDHPGGFSPDGRRLEFVRFTDPDTGPGALYVVNTNGSGLRKITPDWLNVRSEGDWSPRGNEIVFSARTQDDLRQQLWMVRSDGSDLRTITVAADPPCGGLSADQASVGCTGPTWSPTGDRIAFRRNSATGIELVTSCPDGSHVAHVADEGSDAGDADWGVHPLAR